MTKEEITKHKEKLKSDLLYRKEHLDKINAEIFEKLKPFKTIDDIPDIPKAKEETYNKYIIPNLIRCAAIPTDKLVVGKWYIGTCRNASKAVWNGDRFTYKRTKFGYTYDEDINHFQDDNGFDLFVPLKELENE